ncbi:hypothetical protein [Anaerosporobacter sp.]|uniref:hypothetical protein n=1 Tax=Anaerosporobacter sp. TaxID=1872529 RepID=UPI00286EF31A|nr:hypothetical protein [Anaerosporobacter sp.]
MNNAEKRKVLLNKCLSIISDNDRKIYAEIAEYAIELGYTPKAIKTASGVSDALTFTKSKVNRTLLKIRPNIEAGKSQLVMTFFATVDYSDIFKQGIRRVIEAFDGRYTGCYGCGRCKGKLQGYTYTYPDGKKVFRCGRELIELPAIKPENVKEILTMLKVQDEFFMEQNI